MRKCVILNCTSYEIKAFSVHKHIHDLQARDGFIKSLHELNVRSRLRASPSSMNQMERAPVSSSTSFYFAFHFIYFIQKITNFINRDIITYCKLKIFHICNRQSRYVFKKCNLNDLKKLYDTACNRGYVYPRCQSTCSSFNRPESGLFQANGR